MVERKRFQQEIGGARLHRVHSRFHAAECCHHQHRNLRVLTADRLEKLEPVHVRKLEIGEDEVRAVDDLEPLFRARRFIHLEAGGE